MWHGNGLTVCYNCSTLYICDASDSVCDVTTVWRCMSCDEHVTFYVTWQLPEVVWLPGRPIYHCRVERGPAWRNSDGKSSNSAGDESATNKQASSSQQRDSLADRRMFHKNTMLAIRLGALPSHLPFHCPGNLESSTNGHRAIDQFDVVCRSFAFLIDCFVYEAMLDYATRSLLM